MARLSFSDVSLDLCVKVLRYTFLSPGFAAGILITLLSAGVSDALVQTSLWYLSLVSVLPIVPFASRAWTNRLWQRGFWFAGHQIQWDEQIILVTGGSHGIGKALVDTLAARHLVVVSLDKVQQQYDYDDAHSFECDVSNRQQVLEVSEQIKSKIGHPTIIINNAGVVFPRTILDTEEQELTRTLDVNLKAHYWVLQAFLPNLIAKNRGHVVTLASALAFNGAAFMSSYSASKSGAMALHESLTAELKHNYHAPNVRTTLVCPGLVQTGLFGFVNYNTSIQSFIAPPLTALDVVKDIINAIDAEESQVILKPFYVNFLWLLRVAPSWLSDFVRWFSNMDTSVHREAARKTT